MTMHIITQAVWEQIRISAQETEGQYIFEWGFKLMDGAEINKKDHVCCLHETQRGSSQAASVSTHCYYFGPPYRPVDCISADETAIWKMPQ